MSDTVRLEIEGGLATVTLDRPELHLINRQMINELREASHSLTRNDNVRVVVITGSGEQYFTAGVDVKEMVSFDVATARDFIRNLHLAIKSYHEMDKVTIAAINGSCFGGGCELAMACDIRVASSSAMLGLPEIKVGIPSVIEAALLPLLIGAGRARELILLGDAINAEEAERIGLVNKVVPANKLKAGVKEITGCLLSYSPVALIQQKRILNYWLPSEYETAIAFSMEAFSQCFATGEPREAMTAFLEKRKPHFGTARNKTSTPPR